MPRPSVREQLVDAAAECFHERGFNGIGVQEITRVAGVPKGSFYNHFPSKEALAVEVMHCYAMARRWEMLEDRTLAPIPRLRAHFGYLTDGLAQFQFARGCLIGNFGAELSTQSAAIRGQLESGLARWTAMVTTVLEEARTAGSLRTGLDSKALANFLVNAWEGAALRTKVTRSREPLDDFLAVFDSLMT